MMSLLRSVRRISEVMRDQRLKREAQEGEGPTQEGDAEPQEASGSGQGAVRDAEGNTLEDAGDGQNGPGGFAKARRRLPLHRRKPSEIPQAWPKASQDVGR